MQRPDEARARDLHAALRAAAHLADKDHAPENHVVLAHARDEQLADEAAEVVLLDQGVPLGAFREILGVRERVSRSVGNGLARDPRVEHSPAL